MKNLLLVLLLLALFSCQQHSVSVQSPDGKIVVNYWIDENKDNYYSVNYENEIVIQPSFLGLQTDEEPNFGTNVKIVSVSETKVDQTWNPVYGEFSEIRDNYNQVNIHLKQTVKPERELEITFRVYNEGAAFNYSLLQENGKDSILIKNDLSKFTFTRDYEAWVSDKAQSEYRKQKISSIDKPAERPLLVKAGAYFVALGEARLIDFSRMKFIAGDKENSLQAELYGEAKVALPYTTPWRTIMIGKSAGELLENNFMLANLNDKCAIEDVSWIKPGKVIREVTLTTKGGKACVDFAAKNGLQYVEFDAGWYGLEYDDASDATTVTVDPNRSPGPLDLQEVIKYGESKGIGIILYVNRRALEKQLDEILPLFKSWGVKGVKYGFVQVGSQQWTAWLHEAVKKAAKYNLMVDIHDEYRPTGFSRTYPNLMTQEGTRGDEEAPSNAHTLTTLFTRMLSGAADNTNCYFAPRVTEKMGGHVSQLAKAVMMYSPWQFLFWYDRPPNSSDVIGGVPGSDGFIQIVPELEFFKNMPTIWDETKVLEGEIGEFATLARRSGDDWFLGSLTGENAHKLSFKTDFLDKENKYEARIYSYDPDSESVTKVKIEKIEVGTENSLSFEIAANSGLAIHFKKTN